MITPPASSSLSRVASTFVEQREQALVEIAVAQRPVLELAHEQQRPALADEVERVSDGAVLVVGLHGSQS